MKDQLCKVCHNRHPLNAPHIFPATDEAPDNEGGVVEKRRVDERLPTPDEQKVFEKSLRRSVMVVQTGGSSVTIDPPIETSVGDPLTPAEKQKAYRERKGDEYRRRNAERMAAKRRGDG